MLLVLEQAGIAGIADLTDRLQGILRDSGLVDTEYCVYASLLRSL